MNKKINVLKKGLAVGVAVFVMGCATTEGTYRNALENNKAGVIYGIPAGSNTEKVATHKSEMCNKLHLTDTRCNDDKYVLLPVLSEFGFAKGWTGGFGFAKKTLNIPDIDAVNCNTNFGRDKNCIYVKLQVEPNRIGTIKEIVSTPDNPVCHWSGGGKMGGVVCPSLNWDYRKDNQAAVSQ